MLKLEVVVIHMKNNFRKIQVLNQKKDFNYERFLKLAPTQPFNDDVVYYLNDLFKILSQDSRIRQFSDVAAFSFFCNSLLKSKIIPGL